MENKIYFLKEYAFEGLLGVNGNPLRYDFAFFNDENMTKLKCLIEYDGEYHYKPISGEERLKITKEHDKRKNDFCKQNNIQLIRIPYWENKNIENILKSFLLN